MLRKLERLLNCQCTMTLVEKMTERVLRRQVWRGGCDKGVGVRLSSGRSSHFALRYRQMGVIDVWGSFLFRIMSPPRPLTAISRPICQGTLSRVLHFPAYSLSPCPDNGRSKEGVEVGVEVGDVAVGAGGGVDGRGAAPAEAHRQRRVALAQAPRQAPLLIFSPPLLSQPPGSRREAKGTNPSIAGDRHSSARRRAARTWTPCPALHSRHRGSGSS